MENKEHFRAVYAEDGQWQVYLITRKSIILLSLKNGAVHIFDHERIHQLNITAENITQRFDLLQL